MSVTHHIGELLQRGAEPTAEEAEHLTELGAFIASMYERYVHGRESAAGIGGGPDGFASARGGRLSGQVASRWAHGLGIAESLLDGPWSDWWQVATEGFAAGYQDYDVLMQNLALYDDEPERSIEAESEEAPTRRVRQSLFGPRGGASSRRLRPVREILQWVAGAEHRPSLKWADGGSVELATVEALERGGLRVADQVAPQDPSFYARRAANVDTSQRRAGRPGAASHARPTASARSVASLDGLLVDDRTPALSSALGWAEAMFGSNDAAAAGMSLTSARLSAFSPTLASASASLQAHRPVFGFFDAVESDFVKLTPEIAATDGAASPPAEAVATSTPRASLFATVRAAAERQVSVERAAAERSASVNPRGGARPARPTFDRGAPAPSVRQAVGGPARVINTSLATVAPLKIGDDRVLAFSGGVFPTGAASHAVSERRPLGRAETLQFATQISRDRGGVPRPRIQRGNATAPRVEMIEAMVRAPGHGAGAPATMGTATQRSIETLGALIAAEPMSTGGPAASVSVTDVLAATGRTGASFSAGSSWRLAADRGPDLPLAAALTASEVFGAVAAPWSQGVLHPGRAAFAPIVSQSADERDHVTTPGPGFTSRAFGAMEGLVWVAAEQASPARSAVAEPGDELPLSAVPRGRRATMMPAQEALRVVSERAVVRPDAGDTARPVGARTLFTSRVRSGLVAPGLEPTVSHAATQRASARDTQAVGSTGIAQALQSLGVAPSLARWMAASGGVSADLVESLSPSDRRPTGTAPVGRTGELLATGQGQPFIREPASLVTTPILGRTNAVFGAGSYHSLAAAQEMLQFAAESSDGAITGESIDTGAPTPSVLGVSRAAQFDGAVARTVASTQRGRAALDALVTPGATAGPTPPLFREGAPSVTPGSVTVSALAAARQALQRPVVTAREARAMAPLISLVQHAGAPSERATSIAGGHTAWDVMPSLSRAIAAATTTRQTLGQSQPDAGRAGSIALLAQLEPEQVGVVKRTLRAAGWSDIELEMLTLGDVRDGASAFDAAVTDDGALADTVRHRAARRGSATPVSRGEHRPAEIARAAQVTRNLARVLLGAEALGGAVGSAPGIASLGASQAASAQVANFMPMIAYGAVDPYFGAGAPETMTRGAAGARFPLHGAIGALLALASDVSAVSDSPLDQGARAELLHRLASADALVDRMTSARVGDSALRGRSGLAGSGADPDGPLRGPSEARGLGFIDATTLASASDAARPTLAALLGRAEHTFLSPVSEPPEAQRAVDASLGVDGGAPARGESVIARRPGLFDRVTAALNVATGGPGGAERLLGPVTRGAGMASRMGGAAVPQLAEHVRRTSALQAPVALDSVIVPEAMLSGLRSPELSRAMEIAGGAQGPGAFTNIFGDAGDVAMPEVDGAFETRGIRAVIPPGREAALRQRASAQPAPRPDIVAPSQAQRSHSLFSSDPVQVLLRVVGSEPGAMERALSSDRSVDGGERRAALFSALIQSVDRREVASLFQRSGASDFAFAWLSRVDGSRTGLDLGMDGAKTEMQRAFGSNVRRVESRVAGTSPIAGAGLVGPGRATPRGDDRSGLRSLAAHAGGTRRGARSQHAASAAVRRTDWRFVETGSRASTSHADLGRLAAAIVGQSQTAQKAPMPLIAPAAKAVAQTALRLGSHENATGKKVSKPQKAGSTNKSKGDKATLSEEAMDQLAFEMVGRIVRRLGQDKERIGIWG